MEDTFDQIPEEDNVSKLVEDIASPINQFTTVRDKIRAVVDECSKAVIGQRDLIELMIASILADGHVLLEGVPGVAKTLMAKTLSKTIDVDFSRIQFTPDLMPTDISGTSVFNMANSSFQFKKGPIFSNIVLIDEINRAPAKTQAALFEVMEEKQLSFDGQTYPMAFPFLVIATQNPIEQEGTYRLPEAQLDRFLVKINVSYPSFDEEKRILMLYKDQLGTPKLEEVKPIIHAQDIKDIQTLLHQIYIEDHLYNYIISLVHETRNNLRVQLGASPRASLAIMRMSKIIALMEGRNFVIPDDIQYVCPHILNHRIILTAEADIAGLTTLQVIDEIIKQVEVPR